MTAKSASRLVKKSLSVVALVATASLFLTGCAPQKFTAENCKDAALKLGSLLPATGNLAFLGPPEVAGVDLAVKEINEAGGVLDKCVSVLHKDSGDTSTDTATQSATALLNAGVSAIVGAASSGVSLSVIDQITGAKVVQISGANTSPALSTYNDGGFYFRTAPSDVLQGRVLGNLITGDGNEKVGFLTLQDPYGTGLFDNAKKSIEAAGGTVVANEEFAGGTKNFSSQVAKVLAAKPDAIAVISFDEVKSILPELIKVQGFPATKVYLVDGNLANFDADFTDFSVEGAQGTLPGVLATDDFKKRLATVNSKLTEFAYAAESYDATILIALAAAEAGKADGASIAAHLQDVSEGGVKVKTYAEGLAAIKAGKDIDYDGVSGPITFDANGDPTEAYVGIYKYGSDNKYTAEKVEYGKLN
jgi:branched-chain amino acid transport system substrate-binding protein